MATSKSQRAGIWVIAIVMTVGTLGAFFLPILTNNEASKQAEDQQKALAEYQKQQEQAAKDHAASSKPLEGYAAEAFDAATVTELKTEDLVVGDGAEVKADSTIEANYFGWTADGKIFDSTNQNGTVTPASFSLNGVIEGWTKGLTGAKVGSIRKLMIPTAMAYGDSAAANGQPAGPLAFIVEVKSVK